MSVPRVMLLRKPAIGGSAPVRNFFRKLFRGDENAQRKRTPDPERKIVENAFGKYETVEPWEVSERRKVPTYIPKPSYSATTVPQEPPAEPEIKDPNQIECMRHSCMLAKRVLRQLRPIVKPGVTTDRLDQIVHEIVINNGAYPSPLNYRGFPKSICTSVNNVACHGIPDSRPLREGDIVNIDVTVFLNGYHGDCSEMYVVGETDREAERLMSVTELCLNTAIGICKPKERFSSIGNVVEEIARQHGFAVIPAFAGHGIGSYFHGPPDIYNFANDYEGVMHPGMTFTIEPLITQGGQEVEILEDGWTAVTVDNARTAQYEHTILITDQGCDVLTC